MENTLSFYLGNPAEEQRRRRRRGRMVAAIVAGLFAAAAVTRTPERAAPPAAGVQALLPVRVIRYEQPAGPPLPPPPLLPAKAVVTPSRLDFNERASAAQLAIVRNDGGTPIERVTASAGKPFLVTNGCAGGLAPGAECVVAVVFAPRDAGRFTGALDIAADGDRARIVLRGSVAPPPLRLLCFDPPAIRFTEPGTHSITLTNPETAPLRVVRVEALGRTGDTASGYTVDAAPCLRFLGAGRQCTFTVTAAERALQTKETMHLRVEYEDPATGQRHAARPSAACSRR